MSIQQFSRGKVTYGSGSYAPTRGQVSAQGAQGYLKRELRKNSRQGVSSYGADGMSDTRSGVASAALARKNGKTGGIRPPRNSGGGAAWGNGGKPVRPEPVRSDDSGYMDWRNDLPQRADETGYVGGGVDKPGAGNPETPNVTIGANGQLQLPYNANWGQTVLGALGDYNSQLLDLQGQRQQQALDFMNQNKQADADYTNLKRNTLSQSAGNGTAFSSGYGLAVGNNANAYNTFKNNLATQNTMANNQFDLQQSGIVSGFNDILRQGALDLADSTAQNAGSLGFGTTTPPTGPTPIPGNSGRGDDMRFPGDKKPPKKNDIKLVNGAKAKMNKDKKRGRNAS